ncbi:centrosomal protein of 131 kDa-like isoform X2 [Oscarella lobularis]|uniref:centrosomal protein of 131 kDa-like isoform X2 n=1 Tax=Oscarella lobularis TaxID=121494 RepID=UPI0033139823
MSSFRSRFIAPRPTPKSRSEVKARSSAKFGKTEKRESSLSGRTRRPVAATSATVSQQGIKTSSNAERRGARDENKAPSSVTVEFQNVMDQAARTIQAWYRSQRTSRQQANLALHSLLTKKKQERTRLELLARQEKATEYVARKMRAEERSRHLAVEEMRRKREEKWREHKRKEEEEAEEMPNAERKAKASKQTHETRSVKSGEHRPPSGRQKLVSFEMSKLNSRPASRGFDEDAPLDHSTPEIARKSVSRMTSDVDRREQKPVHLLLEDALRILEKSPENIPDFTSEPKLRRDVVTLSQPSGEGLNLKAFLDEVELAALPQPAQVASAELPSAECVPEKDLENFSSVTSSIASKMESQDSLLRQSRQQIAALQKELENQRQLSLYHARQQEKDIKHRLASQKQQNDDAVQRHLAFIDQLIDDKKALSTRCESLVKELKSADTKYSRKIKEMEERYRHDIKKQKELDSAAEKLRRERWIEEKTQSIKEMTVKGLEPEIQLLIKKHKQDVQRIKAEHQAELMRTDERAGSRFVHQVEELREQLGREKERACAHERELARQRYEKQVQLDEANLQKLRQQYRDEVEKEKQRLADQTYKQSREGADLKEKLREEYAEKMAAFKQEHEEILHEKEHKHRTELKELKERLTVEKEVWMEKYKQGQTTALSSLESELREKLKQERDREIEMVIEKLEADMRQTQEEHQNASDGKLRRIREKYEAELKQVEESEKSLLRKQTALKEQTLEMQDRITTLEVELEKTKRERENTREVVERLTGERNNMADIIRQEFADRLVRTEEENKRIKIEMSEVRARRQVELERVKEEKETEIKEIHERVKQAIAKKDDVVSSLTAQYQAAAKRAEHLETMLQHQRQELLKLKT